MTPSDPGAVGIAGEGLTRFAQVARPIVERHLQAALGDDWRQRSGLWAQTGEPSALHSLDDPTEILDQIVRDEVWRSIAATLDRWRRSALNTAVRLLLDRLAADGEDPYGDFGRRTSGVLSDPARWAAFVADANAARLLHTSAWLAGKAALMRRQFAQWEPDRPYSNGAIEGVFDEITRRLWTRRFVFRNRLRLELALRLMLLDKEGIADELRYREAIRSALLRGSGVPPTTRRSLDDEGGSSIHAEVRAVITRTAVKRSRNAKHARASYGRKKAARVSRTRPRSPRRLRQAGFL